MRAIVNLALARGFVGREGCGLMPIRGHSGVQGGAEMGCYATAFPGGRAVERGQRRRARRGMGLRRPGRAGHDGAARCSTPAAARRARRPVRGRRQLPRRAAGPGARARGARADPAAGPHGHRRSPSRCLPSPARTVLLLPAATRYEIPGGVTETTHRAARRPQPGDPRPADRRGAAGVAGARRARARGPGPSCADAGPLRRHARRSARRSRAVVPLYAGIEDLRERRRLVPVRRRSPLRAACEFPTADGRARFSTVPLPDAGRRRRHGCALSTRRGKQFNSMVQERRDSLTGAVREAVLISAEPTPSGSGLADGRGGRSSRERPASCAGAWRWRRSRPATSRSTGPRATS